MLLDSAAGRIRDAHLHPVKENIRSIAEALAAVFEIKTAIYKHAPELQLEPKYEEPPEEIRLANRRLGEAMLAADDLADQGKLAEAREFLTSSMPIEVMVSDIKMPGDMDGFQLADWVGQHFPDIRVVLVSGYFVERTGQKRHPVVTKPYSFAGLTAHIKTLLTASDVGRKG